MSKIAAIAKAELEQRQELDQQVMDLVLERCQVGSGYRVQRGALHQYVHDKLGLIGQPNRSFAKYLNKVLVERGFRCSYLHGAKCYYGLRWKGEDNWKQPVAADLPVFVNQKEKFRLASVQIVDNEPGQEHDEG